MLNISVPPLNRGDKIGITAPARKISREELLPALEVIKKAGFVPVLGKNVFNVYHQFAGTDDERVADFQKMINRNDIKAVIAARGGYGCVKIVDKIDFSPLMRNPKWIAGYSDITVFHNHLANLGIPTLHSTMPVNFAENTQSSLDSLFAALSGKKPVYQFKNKRKTNRTGSCSGIVTGGNLSVLYSIIGSKSFPDTKGKILFLEDVDEHLYHIDRMMTAMRRAGIFKNLSGMIVGAFTKMHNRGTKFGKTAYEIISEAVNEYPFPVAFGFPAGHQPENLTLLIGTKAKLDVDKAEASIDYHNPDLPVLQ